MDQGAHPVPVADGDVTQLLHQWSDGRDEAFPRTAVRRLQRLRLMAGACMSPRAAGSHAPTDGAGRGTLSAPGRSKTGETGRTGSISIAFVRGRCAGSSPTTLEARAREKRRVGRVLPLTMDIRWLGRREEDAFDLDRALSRLEGIDPRKARIVELRVYLGCTAEETADILNLSKATVDRDMRLACAWLCRELRPEQ